MYSFTRNRTKFTVGDLNDKGKFLLSAKTQNYTIQLEISDKDLHKEFADSISMSKHIKNKAQREKYEGYAKGKIYEIYRQKCQEYNLL